MDSLILSIAIAVALGLAARADEKNEDDGPDEAPAERSSLDGPGEPDSPPSSSLPDDARQPR